MKIIFKIAKTELQKLFFSPVAWLILIIFCLQSGIVFTRIFSELVRDQSLGYTLSSITAGVFAAPMFGMFAPIQSYLYLYIPLLTMGVMSQEYSSGSIKLLYSSPITNRQIIFGKYLALVVFALVMIGILFVYCLYASYAINHVEFPLILSGLLGFFLLICAYAAVGLFMSSVTSYAVVAAMGTLGIFALLNYLKSLGQSIETVRDITYWIGISGRTNTFIDGVITSEDVLYFLLIIIIFLGFTLIRVQSERQKIGRIGLIGRYSLVCAIALFLGYLSALPKFKKYADVTSNKSNTLPKSGQAILSKLDGPLTITTYVNMLDENNWFVLPQEYKQEQERFSRYIRFKPEIKLKYVYYYHHTANPKLDEQYPKLSDKQRMDTLQKLNNYKFDILPYSEIAGKIDLAPEHFKVVRVIEAANGKKAFIRFFNDNLKMASEREISSAFKRLTADLPTIGFLTGQGERESSNKFDKGLNLISQEKWFRHSFINQGLDFENVTLDKQVSEKIKVLIIAVMRQALTANQIVHYNEFVSRGGSMIILGEPGNEQAMNQVIEQFGAKFIPGTIIRHSDAFQPGLLVLKPTKEGERFSPYLGAMVKFQSRVTMPSTAGINILNDKGFKVTTLFESDSSTIATSFNLNDDTGGNYKSKEKQGLSTYPTVIALSRQVNHKVQKIIITGDADWLGNGELLMSRQNVQAANFGLISAAFFWMTNGELPIDINISSTPDTSLRIKESGWDVANIFLKWLFPIAFSITAILIWVRRRGR